MGLTRKKHYDSYTLAFDLKGVRPLLRTKNHSDTIVRVTVHDEGICRDVDVPGDLGSRGKVL